MLKVPLEDYCIRRGRESVSLVNCTESYGLDCPPSPSSVVDVVHHSSTDSSSRHDSFLLSPVSSESTDPFHFGRTESQHSNEPGCSKDWDLDSQSRLSEVGKRTEQSLFEKFSRRVKASSTVAKKLPDSNPGRLKKGKPTKKLNAVEVQSRVSDSIAAGRNSEHSKEASYVVQQAQSSGMKLVISKKALGLRRKNDSTPTKVHTTRRP